jgi:hypothetical protein
MFWRGNIPRWRGGGFTCALIIDGGDVRTSAILEFIAVKDQYSEATGVLLV